MFIHRFCSMIVLLGLLFLTLLGNNTGLAAYFVFGILLSFFVTKEICEIFGNINILTNKKVLCIANTVAFIIPFLLSQGGNIEFLRKINISRIAFLSIPVFTLILFIAVLIQVLCSVNDGEKLKRSLMNITTFIFINFPIFLLLLMSSLIPLWSKKVLGMSSVCLNLLRLILQPNIWSFLGYFHVHFRRMCFLVG